jgi:hypothetical protein
MFSFHSGTAAAPDRAFIMNIHCADEGWCVQARPAPFKQIFWEGTGIFQNMKLKGQWQALPDFLSCGDNQPIAWTKKDKGTIHYYRAHVADLGEPAGQRQKPIDGCGLENSPMGAWDLDCSGVGGVNEIPQHTNVEKTKPYCLAQNCSVDPEVTDGTGCPDWYDITIYCGSDPNDPGEEMYTFKHWILGGNFQLHPPVGDSCNFSCPDGVCEDGYFGMSECDDEYMCYEDCDPCLDCGMCI